MPRIVSMLALILILGFVRTALSSEKRNESVRKQETQATSELTGTPIGIAETDLPFSAHTAVDCFGRKIEGFDVMIATLLSKGKTIRFNRVPGVDHGFAVPNSEPGPPIGLQAIFDEVLEWALE